MSSVPTDRTEWLDLLTRSDLTESKAIATYPTADASGPWIKPLLWGLAYHRFTSDEWHQHIANCVTKAIVGEFGPGLLETTLQRIYSYASVLNTVAPYMHKKVDSAHDNTQFTDDLGLVVSLLQDGHSDDPRAVYFRPLFHERLRDYDLLADVQQLLEEDEWGDLPFPRDLMAPIFSSAEADKRFAMGSDGEMRLAQAGLLTSIANRHAIDLASSTYRTAQDARELCKDLTNSLSQTRFGHIYMLGFFADTGASTTSDQDSIKVLRSIASNLLESLSKHERTLWLKLAASDERFYKAIAACCNAHKPSARLPKGPNIIALSNHLRPDWADQSSLWKSLGFTGEEWIDAGIAFDAQQVAPGSAPSNLPDDIAHDR